jgi:hypothetical protein
MKVQCIKNNPSYFFELSVGLWYDVLAEVENTYYISCDGDWNEAIEKEYFMTLKEIRKLKIERIEK